MTSVDHLQTIKAHLDQAELLTQLAEEAAELGKAALKLRRAYTGINPTPISSEDAFGNLLEELADIQTCVIALGLDNPVHKIEMSRTIAEKLERWSNRLAANHLKK